MAKLLQELFWADFFWMPILFKLYLNTSGWGTGVVLVTFNKIYFPTYLSVQSLLSQLVLFLLLLPLFLLSFILLLKSLSWLLLLLKLLYTDLLRYLVSYCLLCFFFDVMFWHCGVVVITTAQLSSRNPEIRFCASSNPVCSMSEICNGENIWQWL